MYFRSMKGDIVMRIEGTITRIFHFRNKKGEDVYRLLVFDSDLGEVYQVITKKNGYAVGEDVDLRVRPGISDYKGNRFVVLFEL